MMACKLTKKTISHILLHKFAFIFSECITITSSEEALKVCEHNFFQWNVVLLIIYLFNHTIYLSQLSSCCIRDLTFSWVQFLSDKLESFVSCNIMLLARNILFWHLYQIRTFNNNLNEEGMITSHLMCANFFMIKIITFNVTTFQH